MKTQYNKPLTRRMTEHKKLKENREKKKRLGWLNTIIVIGVIIFSIYGLIMRNNKLNKSDITICKIIGFGYSPGRGARPEVVNYEYHVDGKLYKSHSFFPHDNSVIVGNCYKLKYSIDDPQVTEVLFEDGKVTCESAK